MKTYENFKFFWNFWNLLKKIEIFEILNLKTNLFFYFRILKIGKPRPEYVLIFPDRQTSVSAGVNFRH
jgi:hypothetical protein